MHPCSPSENPTTGAISLPKTDLSLFSAPGMRTMDKRPCCLKYDGDNLARTAPLHLFAVAVNHPFQPRVAFLWYPLKVF